MKKIILFLSCAIVAGCATAPEPVIEVRTVNVAVPVPCREPMPTAPELDRSAERECIAAATASIYGPSNDRVATYQQQMGVLNEQLASTSAAERSQALRARMATLRQAITREHSSANTLVNAARRRCVEQHRPTP